MKPLIDLEQEEIKSLITLSKKRDLGRWSIAWELICTENERAVAELIAVLKYETDPCVLGTLVWVLQYMDYSKFQKDQEDDIRRKAIEALQEARDKEHNAWAKRMIDDALKSIEAKRSVGNTGGIKITKENYHHLPLPPQFLTRSLFGLEVNRKTSGCTRNPFVGRKLKVI